jgi:hypothetical protein
MSKTDLDSDMIIMFILSKYSMDCCIYKHNPYLHVNKNNTGCICHDPFPTNPSPLIFIVTIKVFVLMLTPGSPFYLNDELLVN